MIDGLFKIRVVGIIPTILCTWGASLFGSLLTGAESIDRRVQSHFHSIGRPTTDGHSERTQGGEGCWMRRRSWVLPCNFEHQLVLPRCADKEFGCVNEFPTVGTRNR